MARYKSRAKRAGEAADNLRGAGQALREIADELRQTGEEAVALDARRKAISEEFSKAEDAKSEIEGLGEEMRSWSDGMSGTNLENSQKYQDVTDAADTIEGINFSFDEEPEEKETAKIAVADKLDECADNMDECADGVEGVEFPGMYS